MKHIFFWGSESDPLWNNVEKPFDMVRRIWTEERTTQIETTNKNVATRIEGVHILKIFKAGEDAIWCGPWARCPRRTLFRRVAVEVWCRLHTGVGDGTLPGWKRWVWELSHDLLIYECICHIHKYIYIYIHGKSIWTSTKACNWGRFILPISAKTQDGLLLSLQRCRRLTAVWSESHQQYIAPAGIGCTHFVIRKKPFPP